MPERRHVSAGYLAGQIERDLTLAEVAERRQFTERHVRDLVRRYKIPVLYTGRKIRFDSLAMEALEKALRRCPSKSPADETPAPSPYRAPSNLPTGRRSVFADALNLMTDDSPTKRPTRSKSRSSATPGTANVVGFDPLRKQS